ncbi:MAG: hypothetical protein SWH54_14865 [Thermodesulfobacteriota bacterium]|nr:hypothetical protein [Thermodesulfobacteriota bacterium]
MNELKNANIEITSENPDYVIVAESEEYDYAKIIEATLMIQEGAKFIATNQDLTGPSLRGPVPVCGAYLIGHGSCSIFPWKAKSSHDVLGMEKVRDPFGELLYDWR